MKLIRKSAIALLGLALLAGPAAANTLRWSNNGDVTSMDPYAYYTTVNASFLQNIYEPLIRYDRNLEFEASLATSWELIEPTVWRFQLRRDVTFHDGRPFTADDVVASLLRASADNSPYQAATSAIKDVHKVDDYTVDVILKDRFPTLLNDLAGIGMMSKGWMEEHDTLRAVNPGEGEDSYASSNANGTGPFKLVSRRADAETILEANPDWWDEPEHNLERVVYRPIGSDATRISALLSGELDFVTPAPLQDIERIQSSDGSEVLQGSDVRIIFLGLNLGKPELNASNITGENPLAKVEVRKALHQAIDKDTLVERILRGQGAVSHSIVAPEIQGYHPDIATEIAPYDPDAAKALMDEAGYPDGFEVGFDCPTDRYVNGEQACQAIAAMWARIGVEANLTTQTMTGNLEKVLSGNSDIYMLGWANTPQLDAFSIINNVLHTRTDGSGRWNPAGFSNAEVDELTALIAKETDMDERQRLMTRAFTIHREEHAAIPLHREPLVWAVREGVEVVQTPDNKVRLWWVRMP